MIFRGFGWMQHLEDMEDIYLADQILARVREGSESTYTLDEVERYIDLAD